MEKSKSFHPWLHKTKFPMEGFILFLLALHLRSLSSTYGQTQRCLEMPSHAAIGFFSPNQSTLLDATINFTLNEIAQTEYLLPNTTLMIKRAPPEAAYKIANAFIQDGVAALIEMPKSHTTSELIAEVMNATSFKISLYDCDDLSQVDDFTMCDHTMTLHHSLRTLNNALLSLLKQMKVSKLIILYDVVRAKQVSHFVEKTKSIIKEYIMVYLNFDSSGQINPHSLNDLKNINKYSISNFILFCQPDFYETIIDIVNLYNTNAQLGSLWVLPALPGDLTLTAGARDKVVGYRLSLVASKAQKLLKYLRRHTDFCKEGLPDSLALLHDSLIMISKAIHSLITSGKWSSNSSCNGAKNFTKNAANVGGELRKTQFQGITGNVSIGSQNERNSTSLNLLMLEKNKFSVAGRFDSVNGLLISKDIKKNRQFPTLKSTERTIRAVAAQQQPFVLVQQGTNNTFTYSGYSYDMLHRLCKDLNLNFKIIHAQNNDMKTLSNYLTSGAADIILNPVIVSAKTQRSLTFTKPLMHFSIAMMVRQKQQGELDLTQFMLPFTIPAWCLLLCSWFVVTIIIHVLDRYSPYGWKQKQQRAGEKGDEFSLFNSLWFCLACILTQGADHTPRNLSGRILACCFWFCILIWNATYTANLASFLTLKDTSLPVKSLADAYSQGYDLTVVKDSVISHVLNISTEEIHRSVWNKIKTENHFVHDHQDGAKKCRGGKTGFIAEKPLLEYIAGRKPCELALISDVLQPMSYAFALPLNSKFVDSLSLGILRLQEKGVTESFERKWWEYRNQCPKTQQEVSQSRLDIKEMLGVYLVLGVGIVLSLLAVAGEIWWKKGLSKYFHSFFDLFTRRRRVGSETPKEKEDPQ